MKTNLDQRIVEIYRKRAKHYDFTANLYYLLGYREWAYRQQTVAALELEPGDTVLEIGCGTGLNFSLYQEAIGLRGKIIGVDLTDAMLAQAQERIVDKGWQNVKLVQTDAGDYQFPAGVNAIISTYAMSLIPENDRILEKAVKALGTGGRLALLELQIPANWPDWLVKISIWLMKPFAVTDEWLAGRPWEMIQQTIRANFIDVSVFKRYMGMTYVIAGRKA